VVRVVEEHEAVVALGCVGHDRLRPPLPDHPCEVAPQRLVDLDRPVGAAEEHALLGPERVGGGLLLGPADAGDVLARHGGVEAAAVAVGDAHDGHLAAAGRPGGDEPAGAEVGVVGVGADDQRARRDGTAAHEVGVRGGGGHARALPTRQQVPHVPGLVEAHDPAPTVPGGRDAGDRAVVGREPDRPLLAETRRPRR
jgi:hypothetical protein